MDPYAIYTNYLFTRRKTFFYVVDPHGAIVFRDRWFWPCVEYLDTIDVKEYQIVPAGPQSRNVKSISARSEVK